MSDPRGSGADAAPLRKTEHGRNHPPDTSMKHSTTQLDPTLRSRFLLAMAPAAVDALPLAAWQERARLRAILAGEAGPSAAAALRATLATKGH